MSIMDGFQLWIGKELADTAIVLGVVAALLVAFWLYVLWLWIGEKVALIRRKLRRAP